MLLSETLIKLIKMTNASGEDRINLTTAAMWDLVTQAQKLENGWEVVERLTRLPELAAAAPMEEGTALQVDCVTMSCSPTGDDWSIDTFGNGRHITAWSGECPSPFEALKNAFEVFDKNVLVKDESPV